MPMTLTQALIVARRVQHYETIYLEKALPLLTDEQLIEAVKAELERRALTCGSDRSGG